jgi:hypothetical protein
MAQLLQADAENDSPWCTYVFVNEPPVASVRKQCIAEFSCLNDDGMHVVALFLQVILIRRNEAVEKWVQFLNKLFCLMSHCALRHLEGRSLAGVGVKQQGAQGTPLCQDD